MSGLLVFGALHHDVVVDAPALPRVDETLVGSAVDYRFGGKGGNQAVSAARMGADVAMLGRIGKDAQGMSLLAALDAAGVDRSRVSEAAAATGMSVAITLPGGDYGAVIVSGANLENDGTPPADAEPAVALIQNEVPEAANLAFVRALPESCRLIWNAAPARGLPDDIAGRVDLLVVNRVEATDMSGSPEPDEAAARLSSALPGDVIVTLGADGLILADCNGPSSYAVRVVTPVSSHGAGDFFVGALAAQLAEGASYDAAIRFAQTAAALFVESEVDRRGQITRRVVQSAIE